MADCGNSGTALDRAVHVMMQHNVTNGNNNNNNAKHVANLLTHASHSASGATIATASAAVPTPELISLPLLPTSQPSMLVPGQPIVSAMQPTQSLNTSYNNNNLNNNDMMDVIWKTRTPVQMTHNAPQIMPTPPLQIQHHQMLMQQQQQQQQLQFQIMAQQQQQQQQLRIMAQQQQKQSTLTTVSQQQQQKPEAKTDTTSQQNDIITLENWHHDLDSLESNTKYQHLPTNVDVDGAGATIEELAAAWAQAEEEYENEYASDLFSSDNFTTDTSYQFINTHITDSISNTNNTRPITIDWMKQGQDHFDQGNLKDAIKSFEMELQCNDLQNALAWQMLGQCHAENDLDRQAIQCFDKAIEYDPYNSKALVAKSVSHVNELQYEQALDLLKSWFTNHPLYAGMELPPDIYGDTAHNPVTSESALQEVKRLLLSALDYHNTSSIIDQGTIATSTSTIVDIYEVLGVVYNVSKEYDLAAEYFQKATQLQPNEYPLWNKLGATLANGNRSEAALQMYQKAIALKPKYARAWLNMAISHANLQSHDEAARCYLQTLSLNPNATHCWSYLRMALSCLERWDLLPFVFAQDLQAFHDHFDFV